MGSIQLFPKCAGDCCGTFALFSASISYLNSAVRWINEEQFVNSLETEKRAAQPEQDSSQVEHEAVGYAEQARHHVDVVRVQAPQLASARVGMKAVRDPGENGMPNVARVA